jgi:hypothetical protein
MRLCHIFMANSHGLGFRRYLRMNSAHFCPPFPKLGRFFHRKNRQVTIRNDGKHESVYVVDRG